MVSAEEAREFPTAFRDVTLPGLAEDEVGEMAGSMLNQDAVPADLAVRLTTMTGGVPAMVEEVMTHWVNAGAIAYRDGAWHLEGVQSAQDLPSGLLDLMAARAAGLSAEARSVAQVAAAIGLEFSLPVLAEATGQDAGSLFPLLLEMVGRGIVEGTDGVSYRFGQPPMRRALHEQLPESGRPALHSRIARALEKFGTGSLEDVSGIASHHLEGEDREAAVRWALEAGRQALDLMAVGDAEKLLERGFALAMAEKAPEPLQLAYREQMGHLCRLTARLDAARQHYEAGLELARKLGDKAALAVCTVALARAHQMRGENKEALARLDEAMPACRAAGDAASEARCQLSLSRIAYFEGRSQDAIAHARSALDVAGGAGALPLVANAQNFLGFLLTHVEPRKEVDGLALLEQSVDLAKRLGDRYQMNESTLNLGNVQLTLGDYPGARESFEACLRYCQEMGATAEEIFALVSLSQVLVEMGRSADALSYAESAASLARGQGRKFPLAFAMAMEAQARLILGDLVKARTLVDDALRLAREIKNRYVELLILGSQAEIQTFLGDWEGAQETIKAARDLMAATGNNEPELKLAILNGYLSAMLFGNDLELRESLGVAQRKHSQGLAARAFAYL
ncbi:MAG: tetratricopeptide repeat protein, partial [Candidatus Sericytochromatia bacterium]|nr:tetratricopeptide repeat protein [Candidatus Tanganyikabacteria bacterium]